MSAETKVSGSISNLGKILNSAHSGQKCHYLELGTDKVILPGTDKFWDVIANFEVRDDDVFILGFPKTGSRWTQEMVWLMLNNLDFEKAQKTLLYIRSPMLEIESIYNDIPKECTTSELANFASPRCIRSHLQWSFLPKAMTSGAKKPKIIVVLRGPEDTCTSYYHQAKNVDGFSGSRDDFCNLFLTGKVTFGPYWKYVLSVWEQRHRPNIMFVKYNEMKTDLRGTIQIVAAFLGKKLTNDDVEDLCHHLTFDNLKNSKGFNLDKFVKGDVNPYIRTGKVGDHKNFMTAEVIEAFRKQRDQYLVGTGLCFD